MLKKSLFALILLSSFTSLVVYADCYECPICKNGCSSECMDLSDKEFNRVKDKNPGMNEKEAYDAALPELKKIAQDYSCDQK